MYDPNLHDRQTLRWRKRDYSAPSYYYVTICIQEHRCLLGRVDSGLMKLNDAGRMTQTEWLKIPRRFPTMRLDEHVTMPNHFHGIIQIVGAPLVGALTPDTLAPDAGTRHDPAEFWGERPRAGTTRRPKTALGRRARPAPTLGDALGAFKSLTTSQYVSGVYDLGWPEFQNHLWQRNYYDHVIRDPDELEKIRDYIRNNPMMWTCDRYNSENGVPVIDDAGKLTSWSES